ncbi:hypothetical protein GE061_017601 [Apolygus lucorum]|uniref:RRM domain-containing protein n=1 Tax=Apolygus lucorum TaxID=248454 RepID=A0A8S9XDK0_APOLU|nr:hypothetical protein GE061_017601 [Apolygus lucorum]
MAVTRKLKKPDAPKSPAKQKKPVKTPPKKSDKSKAAKATQQKQAVAPKTSIKIKAISQRFMKKSDTKSTPAIPQQSGAPKTPIKKKKKSETKSSPAIPQKKSVAPKDPAKKKTINKRLSRKSVTDSSKPDQKVRKKKTYKSKISTSKPGEKPKVKRRKSGVEKAIELNRGVVYFSNLPHGFYEKELRTYCSQFGAVTGVHIPRNEKNNAKGFGFVEFKFPEVAEVVADTMNNYLMFTRLIKAKVVPLEEQKPWIFLKPKNSAKLARQKKANALASRVKQLTPEEEKAYKKKVDARVKRLRNKLEKQGVNYDFTVPSSV